MFRILPKEYDSPLARHIVYAFWIALAVCYYVQDILSFMIREYQPHWTQGLQIFLLRLCLILCDK